MLSVMKEAKLIAPNRSKRPMTVRVGGFALRAPTIAAIRLEPYMNGKILTCTARPKRTAAASHFPWTAKARVETTTAPTIDSLLPLVEMFAMIGFKSQIAATAFAA